MVEQAQELVFVFEVCSNCEAHQSTTRHDESKYIQFYAQVSEAIKAQIPNAKCLKN